MGNQHVKDILYAKRDTTSSNPEPKSTELFMCPFNTLPEITPPTPPSAIGINKYPFPAIIHRVKCIIIKITETPQFHW